MPTVPFAPVSIATDLALPIMPVTMTFHDFVFVTPPSTGIAPCIELPVTMMWPPGFALAQNKLTLTVLHKMMPIALDGHNCGYMIPHVTLPPVPLNTLTPFQIMFSSRKMMFASSIVKAEKAQVACNLVILTPMACCANPVTLPTGIALLNVLNTVIVGMTWMDVLAGWIAMAITMVTDKFIFRSKEIKGQALDLNSLFEKFVAPLTKKAWTTFAKKAVVGLVSGAIRLALTGEGSLSVKVGTDYANTSVTFAKTADGQWSVAAGAQLGGPVGPTPGNMAGIQGKYQYTHNPDGSTSSAFSGSASEGSAMGPGGVGARQSASTTNSTDAKGKTSNRTSSSSQVIKAQPERGSASSSQTTNGKTTGTSGQQSLGRSWADPL